MDLPLLPGCPSTRPIDTVDEVVVDWERDLREEDAVGDAEEDPTRQGGSHHAAKAYSKAGGERVRAHLARKPRRSRKRIAA